MTTETISQRLRKPFPLEALGLEAPRTAQGGMMKVMAKKPAKYTPEKIKALRERLELNQTQAGAKVGVSQNLWSAWEKGTRTPSPSHLILLALLDAGKV